MASARLTFGAEKALKKIFVNSYGANEIEKLTKPSHEEGAGLLSSVTDTRTELFISKGIPYLAKRGVEAGRHYPSEPMRDPALKKKAINYGTRKPRPAIEKVRHELINQVRPYKRYQTDRADTAGFDILTAIEKLPSPLPKKGCTLHEHN